MEIGKIGFIIAGLTWFYSCTHVYVEVPFYNTERKEKKTWRKRKNKENKVVAQF